MTGTRFNVNINESNTHITNMDEFIKEVASKEILNFNEYERLSILKDHLVNNEAYISLKNKDEIISIINKKQIEFEINEKNNN